MLMVKSIKCFWELVRREIVLFSKEIVSKLIDTTIILFTTAVVFGYLFKNVSPMENYGQFIVVGAVVTFGLFEIVGRVADFIGDLTGAKVISNYLILPLPSFYVFSSIAIGWGICSLFMSVVMVPLAKLFLLDKFDLSHFSIIKFSLIIITSSFFYAFFALWLSSLIKNLRSLSWLWCRVINPMFMFCGYFYTWTSVYKMSHVVGILHLFNPMIYVLEGARASVLGQSGYLPYWTCFFVLWAFIIFFATDGTLRLKRRLDCI
jgi:ABC-2 type transport system permease protein